MAHPVGHYLLYLCSFWTNGVQYWYVGITGVLVGQAESVAKKFRRWYHINMPVSWLTGAAPETVTLETLATGFPLRRALIDETRETAKLCKEKAEALVRGGPWCRCRLPKPDRQELDKAFACQSRDAVESLAIALPHGSLAARPAGASYSRIKTPTWSVQPTLGKHRKIPPRYWCRSPKLLAVTLRVSRGLRGSIGLQRDIQRG